MTTIGIDLTPIQGPHRMRGVGATAINIMRHLSDKDQKGRHFVLYLYDQDKQGALDLVNAEHLLSYEVRIVEPAQPLPPSITTKAGLLHAPTRLRNAIINRRLGDRRITHLDDIDVFLQFEQDVLPPRGVRSVVVAYDLIPYVLEDDYLWNYQTARHKHHYSRRGALKAHLKRSLYLSKIKAVMNRAKKIVAISEHTKQDFVKYLGLSQNKIEVVHLGVSEHDAKTQQKPKSVERYVSSSWGDVKITTPLPDTPFLLFVGGADPRRKLADLVFAFNLLRAQGHHLHLVLAGDTMLGPNSIPNDEARRALLSSSYLDDIHMLGFVDEPTREWLYQNTLAFVYPSTYEGFGLPILEAMHYGSPVITYKNSSIAEIGGDKAIYVSDFASITAACKVLLERAGDDVLRRNERMAHAKSFMWPKTSHHFINQ